MPASALDKMSVKDLNDLDGKIKKAMAHAREREMAAVKQKLDAIIQNAGMDIREIAELYGFGRGRGARKGTKVAPKYRNPDNKTETWSGRGLKPRWLTAKLNKGGKLPDFAI